jgi:hypothetical protein
MSARTPSYRLHKPSGQAVTTISGHDFYLGRHDTPASQREYDRLIAEWLANGRRLPVSPSGQATDLTINELILGYLLYADEYYRKNGQPTTEPGSIRLSVRPLRHLYGTTLARDFGPKALKTVRGAMVMMPRL